MADMKDLLNSKPQKIQLDREMTLEEIFNVLNARAAAFPTNFAIKSGITGKHIAWDAQSGATPQLFVKGTEITIQKQQVSNQSGFSVGGVGIPSGGSPMEHYSKGEDYFRLICEIVCRIFAGEQVEDYPRPTPEQVAAANDPSQPSEKDWLTTLLLLIFVGTLGIHRFYVGKIGTGILYLLTLGLCGIGWIVDLVKLLTGKFTDKQERLIVKK